VDAVGARIPTWKAGLINNAGRLTLTKSTQSAIPVHISICCCLSAWAIDQIDRRRQAFMWSGVETTSGGKCRVAWRIACSPKEYGGLGIPDLRIMGFALRLRWEWLRRSNPNAAWTSLPSKTERPVAVMFQASVSVRLGDDASALF
jgi:hypothetical protein